MALQAGTGAPTIWPSAAWRPSTIIAMHIRQRRE